MKNTFKIIVGILLCFALLNNVKAEMIYSAAIDKASEYVYKDINYKSTYSRYIYTEMDPSVFNKVYKNAPSGKFKYGGLLSYDEFKKTKNGREENEYSYLYTSSSYWTYTGEGTYRHVVSHEIDEKLNTGNAEKSNLRVTEVVIPTVSVTGEGTYSDPWIFEPQFKVTIKTNGKGKISQFSDESTKEDLISFSISSNAAPRDIYIFPGSGYEYLGNTCGIVMNDIDVRNNTSQILKVTQVTRDIECIVNFGEKPYTVNLDPSDIQYKDMSDPNPTTLYVIKEKAWYSDALSTNAISYMTTAPSLNGYTFEGYRNESNYTNGKFSKECKGVEIIDINKKLGSAYIKDPNDETKSIYTDNMTLYPCFKPITYTVNYNCGDNEGTVATSTHVYNEPKKLLTSSSICSKTGYTFVGWARDINGENPDRFYDNTNYSEITHLDEVTLYAQWTPNQYTITYNLGNATSTAGTKNIGSQTCTFDSDCTLKPFLSINSSYPFPYSYEYEQKDTTNNKNYGWSFYGWTTNKSIKPDANDKIDINYTDNQTFKYTIAENISLYAIGERTTHFNGGINPKEPYKEPKQYWNPYSTNDSYVSNLAVPTAQEINTWTFIGYKCGSSEASNSSITMAPSIAGTKYKLSYNKYPYIRSVYSRTLTVAYDANGGTGTTASQTKTQYYNTGYGKGSINNGANSTSTSFTLATSGYTKTGYNFSNWTEDSTNGIGYNAKAAYTFSPSANNTNITKTMYAKWSTQDYSITYTLNGGTNPTGAVSSYNIETATFNLPTPTRKGYTFDGWYKESGFTNKVTQITKGTTGNKTYYAKWTAIDYTITYILNSGTNASDAKTSYNIETATYTLPTPTRTGYTFDGWYTESGFTNKVTKIAKGSTGNKTYYAKWTMTNYTITYELNGGTNPSGVKTSYNINTATYTLPTPTRTDYTFDGWYTESGFKNKVTKIEKGTTGNKKYYAKWNVIDGVAPSCSLAISSDGKTINATYSDNNGGSGIKYYGWNSSYSGTKSATKTATNGEHIFYVMDNAGNKKTCNVKLDNTSTEVVTIPGTCDSVALTYQYQNSCNYSGGCNVYNGVYACTYNSSTGKCDCIINAFRTSSGGHYCCNCNDTWFTGSWNSSVQKYQCKKSYPPTTKASTGCKSDEFAYKYGWCAKYW